MYAGAIWQSIVSLFMKDLLGSTLSVEEKVQNLPFSRSCVQVVLCDNQRPS